MIKGKRVIAVVLAMAVLVGIGGCGELMQSIPESSAGSFENVSSGSVSSISSITERSKPPLTATLTQTEVKINQSSISKPNPSIDALNFSMYTGIQDIQDICLFEDGLIGVLSHDSKKYNSDLNAGLEEALTVFSAVEMKPLYQVLFTTQSYISPVNTDQKHYGMNFILTGENRALVLSRYDGWDISELFFNVTKTGVTEISPDQVYGHRLSDSVTILEDKNNLVLNQNGESKTLLSGFYYTDPNTVDDYHDWEGYSFCYRLDDTHFVYEKFGWEWTEYTGIYDIETGETTILTYGKEKNFGFDTAHGTKIILSPDRTDGFISYGPYLYDVETGALTNVNWFNFSDQDEIFPKFFLFDNMLVAFIHDTSELRLFDIEEKTEKSPIYLDTPYDLSDSVIDFMVSGEYLYFYSRSWTYDSFLFRIQIGEVTK